MIALAPAFVAIFNAQMAGAMSLADFDETPRALVGYSQLPDGAWGKKDRLERAVDSWRAVTQYPGKPNLVAHQRGMPSKATASVRTEAIPDGQPLGEAIRDAVLRVAGGATGFISSTVTYGFGIATNVDDALRIQLTGGENQPVDILLTAASAAKYGFNYLALQFGGGNGEPNRDELGPDHIYNYAYLTSAQMSASGKAQHVQTATNTVHSISTNSETAAGLVAWTGSDGVTKEFLPFANIGNWVGAGSGQGKVVTFTVQPSGA